MKNIQYGMRPVHPGEILREELGELGLSARALAGALGVSASRIATILRERRGITADTALRLARFFGTTPQIWLNFQQGYDLRKAEIRSAREIDATVKPRREAAKAVRRSPNPPPNRPLPTCHIIDA